MSLVRQIEALVLVANKLGLQAAARYLISQLDRPRRAPCRAVRRTAGRQARMRGHRPCGQDQFRPMQAIGELHRSERESVAPECRGNSRLLCRGTKSSNPSLSSRESSELSVPGCGGSTRRRAGNSALEPRRPRVDAAVVPRMADEEEGVEQGKPDANRGTGLG